MHFVHKSIAEIFEELQKGLNVLASKYSTAEARKILSDGVPLVAAIKTHMENEDHVASLDIIKKAFACFEIILKHEPKHGGGAAVELSNRYLTETGDLIRKAAKIDDIFAWIISQVDTLEHGLNNGKPF